MDTGSCERFESQIVRAFAAASAQPTAECIDEETLWELVERGGSYAEADRIISHLSHCIFCHQGFAKMQEVRLLSTVTQPELATIAEQRARRPGLAFWNRVTEAMAATVEPVLPRRLAFQHAALGSTPNIARQSLIFDDANVTGSYSPTGDEYELRIEHSTWTPGTLVLLETLAADGDIRFCRFYVLKDGWERAALDTIIEASEFSNCILRLCMVNLGQLESEEAPPLKFAFLSAVETDPDTLGDWQNWARLARTNELSPDIEAVAQQILEWPTKNQ